VSEGNRDSEEIRGFPPGSTATGVTDTAAYAAFHRAIVEECVKQMGEHTRFFFLYRFTYETQFTEKKEPAQVADALYKEYGRRA
jgi:hypothetical protein